MQKAIIVDIDGTIAQSPRPQGSPVDWKAWMESTRYCPVNEWCRQLVISMSLSNYTIIFLTSRDDSEASEEVTNDWLKRNLPISYKLLMRRDGDHRPDYEVKEEIYKRDIMPFYDVDFVVDDKSGVIAMFRELGIPALHCAHY